MTQSIVVQGKEEHQEKTDYSEKESQLCTRKNNDETTGTTLHGGFPKFFP